MTEKLKIYVTARIAEILLKDAEGFEFFKSDGRTVNKNALLTRLIVNYHLKFAREQEETIAFLKKKIAPVTRLAEDALDSLCCGICEKLNERVAASNGEKFDKLISLKPTKESEPLINYIEQYSLAGRTLSEYFRSMFAAYASLPQDKREEIIFKPQVDAILKAVKEKKQIFITTKNNRFRRMEISPYSIANSKEELHLYVLATQPRGCITVRLSRITSVVQLPAEAKFTQENIAALQKMIKYGPQFRCRDSEDEVLVKLTAAGIEKFKKIYVHRPVPVCVEGDFYRFDCSHTQIVQYFSRFGADAEIIYPENVRTEIYNFHRRAANAYDNKN